MLLKSIPLIRDNIIAILNVVGKPTMHNHSILTTIKSECKIVFIEKIDRLYKIPNMITLPVKESLP